MSYDQPARKTEAEAVAEIQRRAADIQLLNGLAAPVAAHPANARRELESLERYLPLPLRKRARIDLSAHDSFIDYVERHKEPGTALFCEINESGGSFTAILDYHRDNEAAVIGEARWGEHVCVYTAEFTPEWKRWRELSGKLLSQAKFALFMEDNQFDIAKPDPAAMLEIAKTLEATQGATFKSSIRLDNGDRQFAYAQNTEGKAGAQGNLEIPKEFTLRFAIFTNGPAYDIPCRFRWAIEGGVLGLGFELVKPHKLIELALVEARNAIQQTLKLPVLFGSAQLPKL